MKQGNNTVSTLYDSTGHVATSSWSSHVIHVQVAGGLTDKPNVSVLRSVCSAPSLRNVHPARFDCSPDPLQNQIRAKGLDFLERIWPTSSYRQINLSLASNWGHIQSHSSDLIQDQLSLYYFIRNYYHGTGIFEHMQTEISFCKACWDPVGNYRVDTEFGQNRNTHPL